jgi:hypothetical protein
MENSNFKKIFFENKKYARRIIEIKKYVKVKKALYIEFFQTYFQNI